MSSIASARSWSPRSQIIVTMILLVALSFNLVGDGLRDALDPRGHIR